MQIHHEADPKQQCDRDANVVTKSFDAKSYDFDSVTGPLAPRARILQPILLLFFFVLLLLNLSTNQCLRCFFIPSQNLVAFKTGQNLLKKGDFRTFSNI